MTRKVWKKGLALLFALVLMTAALPVGTAALAEDAAAFEPLSFPLKDPITLNVFSWYWGDFDPNNALVKEFERLTNIKLVYNAPADGYEEKESLLLTADSKDWPDIMLIGVSGGRSVAEISRLYGKAGKFVNISKYADKMPNLKAYYEAYPEAKTLFQDENGDAYIFPYLYPYRTIPTGFFVNDKAFAANNIAYPTNTEELYQAAKKLKEAYPNSYPVTSYTVPETLTVWSRVFGTSPTTAYFSDKDAYQFGPLMPEYREMLEYLNKLYTEELYDPQFPQYVFAGDDWRQTLASQKSFISESYVWEMQYENANSINSIAKNMGMGDSVDFKYIKPLEHNGKPSHYWGLSTVSPWYGMIIKTDSPYVNEILSLLDWELSEKFFNLLGYGIEGVTYDMADGKPVFKDTITTTGEEGKTNLNDFMSFYAGVNIYEIYPDPLGWKANLEKFTGYTMDQMAEFASWPEPWTVSFDQDTKDAQSLITTPVGTLVEEMSYKFITGELGFDQYESFLEQLKGLGIESVVTQYNDYYNANIKK
jgi:putative aldouronate transport system substrate-binding protein